MIVIVALGVESGDVKVMSTSVPATVTSSAVTVVSFEPAVDKEIESIVNTTSVLSVEVICNLIKVLIPFVHRSPPAEPVNVI